MTIAPGALLGSYEVTAQIGAGGMGEVYQAHDTKLGRNVAIKVLPAAFAHDADRLARFQREAKMLAALNHPNIATIHGLEHSDGTHFLVMELVQGETLADRVKAGPVPVEEALKIAMQIAEALEAAHEKNIIHRDLKPANAKLTPDGKVKVLDFGLAKAFEGDIEGSDLANSPTLTQAATMQGVILGTAAYMSPEQARGKTVDKRTDIWAFGAVVYELLTAKPTFHGEDITEILASVVKSEPDWTALPANISPSIRILLQRCLRKDRRQRLPDAAAIRIEIEDALAVPKDSGATPAASASRSKLSWVAAAVLSVVATGASFIAYRATRPLERPLMRFTDDLGAEIALSSAPVGPVVAISPDGSRLAYVSRTTDGTPHISVRLLESPKSFVLAGTEGAGGPFFSPDSRWIGFFADNALKKISVDGGAAVILCDTGANPRMGSWGEDGNIFFANQRTPVMRVPATGGTPSAATKLDNQNGEVSNRGAQLLPGGEAFLFEASKDNNVWEDATIQVQSVKTGQRKTLVQGGYFGQYIHGSDSAAGYLIYTHGGTLFAAPMDLGRLELTGPAVPVLQDVSGRNSNGMAQIGFTVSGTLVYIAGSGTALQSLAWLDAAGNTQSLPAAPGSDYVFPRISPDGTRIAMLVMNASGFNIWVYEWGQDRMTRLTFFRAIGGYPPIWAPDGKHIGFVLGSSELSGSGIYWMRSDGAGEPQQLVSGQNLVPDSFSPNGKRLAYFKLGPDYGIWTVPLDLGDPEHPKAGKPELFLGSKSVIQSAAFSPDGRWMAYSSSRSGLFELFVRPFPGPGGQWQVSSNSGRHPIWSRDGRALFYEGGKDGNELMAAPYTVKGDSFDAGQPRLWSQKPLSVAPNSFDVAPDGKRALVVIPAPGAASAERPTHVTFLLNFADELRRRTAAQTK